MFNFSTCSTFETCLLADGKNSEAIDAFIAQRECDLEIICVLLHCLWAVKKSFLSLYNNVEYVHVHKKVIVIILLQGEPNDRIVFTSAAVDKEYVAVRLQESWHRVRLTDGPNIHTGRLQIYHNDQWRSVCTNSRKYVITHDVTSENNI